VLERLKQVFASRGMAEEALTGPSAGALAAAMLLLEVAWADHEISAKELNAARRGIGRLFGLDAAEVDSVLARARREHENVTAVYPFTRALNDALTPVEKRDLVSTLWRLAYADAELTGYEEHTIRRIADLLHVSHRDFIAAKRKSRDAVTGTPPRES